MCVMCSLQNLPLHYTFSEETILQYYLTYKHRIYYYIEYTHISK